MYQVYLFQYLWNATSRAVVSVDKNPASEGREDDTSISNIQVVGAIGDLCIIGILT